MLKLLTDERFDKLALRIAEVPECKEQNAEIIELQHKLKELIKDIPDAWELYGEIEACDGVKTGIEIEKAYEQGFKDAIEFLSNK